MMTEPVYTLAATAGSQIGAPTLRAAATLTLSSSKWSPRAGSGANIEPGSRTWLLCCQQTGTVDLIGGTEQLREVRLRTGVVPCPLAL